MNAAHRPHDASSGSLRSRRNTAVLSHNCYHAEAKSANAVLPNAAPGAKALLALVERAASAGLSTFTHG
jgi:hypothetical protein